ncbi:MAG: dihydroorotase [Bacillus sp. (in: Bacteria)]|nr:dihydroorotase [Bacillus sp. (in: firmicutes)]MCM1426185.1 dihydroorotase [Eubacterium sp.]
MIHIINGYVIDPKSGLQDYRDILVKGGKVAAIAGRGTPLSRLLKEAGETECEPADGSCRTEKIEQIDADGQIIAPGLVDVHVHFRDPGFTYKEDIISGAAAAAKGGFTTVVLMANTKPAVDTAETLSYVLEKGKQTGIHIHTCANVTMGMQGKELVDMEALSLAGAAGFTDDGIPIMEEEILRKALQNAARLHKPVSLHEEDPAYITNNGIHAGKASAHYHIKGSPREAEISMVRRDIEIAMDAQASIEEEADMSIQHISTKEAVELVRQAKKRSSHIYAEATPHHFTLTQEAAITHGTLAKMNPPLREEADRMAIIEGLRDGTIDMIATDHAPHSEEEKAKPITEAPSGIIGLETALSLGIRELVAPGYLNMLQLMEKMSLAPAKLYHLDAGYIAVNALADLVIFQKDAEWKVEKEKFASKACNSPFIGETLPGIVTYTICGGKIVYRNEYRTK